MHGCKVIGGRIMQKHRSFPWTALVGSLALAACLTIPPSPYDAARGFSTTLTISNTASKGDRLTARPRQAPAMHSGKLPVGCETAVSRFARGGDFTARRCI